MKKKIMTKRIETLKQNKNIKYQNEKEELNSMTEIDKILNDIDEDLKEQIILGIGNIKNQTNI